ncbi:peptidylprolyl isomerase [Corynebacterium sp. ES2794-CONJ1]|uniref:peptidylprolyl isomerase n=1 Tax=unclassified Corynebacterium TaxID=2624378 RepID=UPI0021673591|nr:MULTISPECIES: peptidylprolyl isomerase [unclassified Corynebacterium]MCS4489235.1 peptidylprolyl isomerase [Corynebacterium sp. ES2775-CONJ]MCS4531071.1 peptidylprolyl isomerase [Corynebacterium sp. ES2730-CONJ]MCU9518438.1 peptidylprolyl isomerase [Corynebacterium sp. ES2794-CONJ1]
MSDNKQRREEALRDLEKEIASRDRAERLKPLGLILTAALAIVVIIGGVVLAVKYTGDDASNSAAESIDQEDSFAAEPLTLARAESLQDTVSCDYAESGTAAKKVSLPDTSNIQATGTVSATMTTNSGEINLDLDRSVSPCTVNAFTHLASEGYFNDTVCHRLTTSEGLKVLQCGDPTGTGTGGPGFSFANEYPTDEASEDAATLPVIYPRGTIAMANSGPDTNGSQFFLNYGDSTLPPQYTYFGKIDEAGLKTLDAIAKEGVDGDAMDGAPAKEVKISKVTVGS